MASLVHNITEMIRLFTEIATASPVTALLVLAGAILVGLPVLVFGYLALGGLVSPLIPDSPGRAPPQ
ncbi:hypothetical protein [Haladaptatus sp. NG-SE-30]